MGGMRLDNGRNDFSFQAIRNEHHQPIHICVKFYIYGGYVRFNNSKELGKSLVRAIYR
jgi:hypothetical protein